VGMGLAGPVYLISLLLFDAVLNDSVCIHHDGRCGDGCRDVVDDVLDKHGTKRFTLYEGLDGEEFWQNIEDTALTIDDARRHFGE